MNEKLSITTFERLVYSHKYQQAVHCLIDILNLVALGGGVDKMETDISDSYTYSYTRLAAAVTALITDPGFRISPAVFQVLALHHSNLEAIFAASDYRSQRHLLELNDSVTPGGRYRITSREQLMRFLLCCSLENVPVDLLASQWDRFPELMLMAWIGLLANRVVVTPAAEQNREKLLRLGPHLAKGKLTDAMALPLSNVWMYCSYTDGPEKHEIKKHINALYRSWLAGQGVRGPTMPAVRRMRGKPHLIVASERFRTSHIMFRCYASFVEQLRRKFHLILVAEEKSFDEPSRSLFDEVIETGKNVQQVAALIAERAPDLIYYPSLGMSFWSVALANLRLAPIQFMTTGHPATSYSPEMDYVLIGHDLWHADAFFSEKVVVLNIPGVLYQEHLEAIRIEPEARAFADPLRIAVDAKSMKINSRFLAVCQRIKAAVPRTVEYHFFPNETRAVYYSIARQLKLQIADAFVHPALPYNDYIRNLNRCDIALSPFPFGNAGSTVDALGQAIPVVAHVGVEPHARTDYRILRALALPEWLMARDEDSYVMAALRLADDIERLKVANAILEQGVDRLLFQREHGQYETDFVDAVWWIYENHESLREDNRRVIFPAREMRKGT